MSELSKLKPTKKTKKQMFKYIHKNIRYDEEQRGETPRRPK